MSPKFFESQEAVDELTKKLRRGNIFRRKRMKFCNELMVFALRFEIGTTGRGEFIMHYLIMHALDLKTLTEDSFWWTAPTYDQCVYEFFLEWTLASELPDHD